MHMREMKFTDAKSSIMPSRITFALNLCDAALAKIDVDELIASVEQRISPYEGATPAISRIYMGSYCCERSFLGIASEEACELGRFCNENSIAVTLVTPSPLESLREAVHRKAERIMRDLGDAFDELCVNDIGTLSRAIELGDSSASTAQAIETGDVSRPTPALVAGRLFFKQQRDPRTPEAIMASHMSAASLDLEQEIGAISCIEADLAFTQLYLDESIPAGCTLALHYPFTLVSRMRVCQFAHDSHPASPFTAAAPCRFECRSEMMEYRAPEGARFYKAGKSIVAPTDATLSDAIRSLPSDRPIRIIWQPSFEEVTR